MHGSINVIVTKHLYSATLIRGAPDPGHVFTDKNMEVFRCLRNWSDDIRKRSL